MSTARIDRLKYGKNEIGKPQRSDGSWFRVDTFTNYRNGESTRERHFAAGPEDDSPLFCSYITAGDYPGIGKYDPDCSCCWLNFSHTVAAHNARLKGSAKP